MKSAVTVLSGRLLQSPRQVSALFCSGADDGSVRERKVGERVQQIPLSGLNSIAVQNIDCHKAANSRCNG